MTTVVSAYYPIPSKFSTEKYLEWIRVFWSKTVCPLIFFTDPSTVPAIQACLQGRPHDRTLIIGLPFQDLQAYHALSPEVWVYTQRLDPERGIHSAELYALWYEKKEFVLHAIKVNPFHSETFVWCDAGICRYPDWVERGIFNPSWPLERKIPRGQMLALQVDPFRYEDFQVAPLEIDWTGRCSIGGGILASDVAGWTRWSAAYDRMLMKFFLAGKFIGKDQNIMAAMILEDQTLAVVIEPASAMNSMQKWFYLLFYLSGLSVV
jgi:hypothetical protein